jgi:hypothetical protein
MSDEADVAVAVWFDDVTYNRETGEVTIGTTKRIEAEALDYDGAEEKAKIENAAVEAIHNKVVSYIQVYE